ncbi:MAG: 3-oxoacyl-[acyl-carrier protein] reductase [Candidatus Azotimanducaceae bacterium]
MIANFSLHLSEQGVEVSKTEVGISEERVVLITGGATGLGSALVQRFAKEGFRVVLNYHRNQSAATTLVSDIENSYGAGRIKIFQADVSNRSAVSEMFSETLDTFGRVDILINSAGVNRDSPFMDISDDTWDEVMSSHLKGHFICGQEFVRANPDRDGVIINMGAAAGSIGRRNGANFCAAKAGIAVLTKCMALELAPRIRVNCLVPGSVQTREVIERYDLETEVGLAKELSTLPLGRLGEFDELTDMALCMVGATFTTGAKFFVNGGQYMH